MNRIRVLMISPQFRPLYGGYERAAERLSEALAGAGHVVVVLTERQKRAWPATETLNGYRIERKWCWHRRRFHTISTMLSFGSFLLRHGRRFDIWHVHQYGHHAGLTVVMGRLLRRPVVLKLTNSAAQGIERTLGTSTSGRLLSFLHRRVNACVAVSEETRKEAIAFGIPAELIHLIPNGLEGSQLRPATPAEREKARQALGLDCMTLILSVGRLSEEKNPLGLVEAWAAVDPVQRRNATLVIVGDGPQDTAVRARIDELGLGESVALPGRRNDIETWYQASDFYVIASHNEGLSNSMIEAMAAGLPVISTRVSGSSVLTDSEPAGIVVDLSNPLQLARALEDLLRDSEMREKLAFNARMLFESQFLMERVCGKLIRLYEEMRDRKAK